MLLLQLIGNFAADAAGGKETKLEVTPRLCILDKTQDACREKVWVSWRSGDPLSACLYRENQGEPLQCWRASSEGRFRVMVETVTDVAFELREEGSGRLLARAVMQVASEHEFRRRRRNPWRYF